MRFGLGVDLGTISTAAAAHRSARVEMLDLSEHSVVAPAVVFAHPDGHLLTGDAAARRMLKDPDRVAREFKRRLGDPTPILLGGSPFSPGVLMAAGLRACLDRAGELYGEPPERVVLTYPAVWRTYRREQFTGVAALGGASEPGLVETVPEPVAAAAWYAASHAGAQPGDVVAVYDLGGGTFDAAVVRIGTGAGDFEVLGEPEGVEWLGGVDFDEAVLGHVDRATGGALSALSAADPRDAAVLIRVREECTAAKESLSTETEVVLHVPLASGDRRVDLTRAEFEDLVRPMLTVTTEALARVLDSAGVRSDDLAAVLLVGGSSNMPLVRREVETALDRPVLIPRHPDQVVASGAAWLADPEAQAGRTGRTVQATARPGPPVAAPRAPGPETPVATAPAPRRPQSKIRNGNARRVLGSLAAVGVLLAIGIGAAAYALSPTRAGHPQASSTSAPSGTGTGTGTEPTADAVPVLAGRVDSVGGTPNTVAFSPDGRTAYVTSIDPNVLTVVDTGRGRVSDTVLLDAPPQNVVTSADGLHVYVSLPGHLAILDPVSGRQVAAVPVGPHPGNVAVTPDGTRVLVPDEDDGTLMIVDPASFSVITTLALPGPVVAVAVMPDGRRAFALDSEEGRLFAVDVATGRVLATLRTGSLPTAVAAGPSMVAVADYDSGSVSLFDPASLSPVATVPVGDTPQALAFGRDGRSLYVVDDTGGTLTVVDTLTRQVRTAVPVGVGPTSIAVSRAGLVYVVDAKDETVSVLRIPEPGTTPSVTGGDG